MPNSSVVWRLTDGPLPIAPRYRLQLVSEVKEFMKIWMTTFIVFGLTFGAASFVAAQEDPTANPTEDQQQRKKQRGKEGLRPARAGC